MKSVFRTDCGKIREHNEDNGGVFTKEGYVLAVVADGMGGEQAGEVASALALESLTGDWETTDISGDEAAVADWLKKSVKRANKYIYNYAKAHAECRGMGTTIVAALCEKDRVTIANVGDSRCYILREGGAFMQVTEDHSLVNQLMKSGQLSEEDADRHPMKHMLTRALGTEEDTAIDVTTISWSSGDCLILCSDGLSNMVPPQAIVEVLSWEGTLEEKAERLIALANEAGGLDNITITIVENDDGGEQ